MPNESQDLHAAIDLVQPFAATQRITLHFGAANSDPGSRARESKASRYVVWIGDRYDRSEKSLCHAAQKVINKINGGHTC